MSSKTQKKPITLIHMNGLEIDIIAKFGVYNYLKDCSAKNSDLQSLTVAYVRSRTGLLLFGTFELAIFMPFELRKSCIPQKKALLPIVKKKF